MAQARRSWWWIYALCASAVLAALGYVSAVALRFERDALCAAEQTLRHEHQRTALWRLDSYLLPILSREGARPYFEYLAYYPQQRSYTRFLSPLEPGEVLVASPLLSFAPEHVRLHFQVDANGTFSSPQAPEGNLKDLAQATCAPGNEIPDSARALMQAAALVPLADVRALVKRAEQAETQHARPPRQLEQADAPPMQSLQSRDTEEWAARQKNAYKAKLDARNDAQLPNRIELQNFAPLDADLAGMNEGDAGAVVVGSLVPAWVGPEPELFFFRRITVGANELLQGIWLDWPGLERALLAEVGELLPGAKLTPVRDAVAAGAASSRSALATIPVELTAPPAPATPELAVTGFTATRTTLALAAGAVLAALVGGFLLLRSSLLLGERRSRFASAVTHELRTPLTTFRMYSEMLADGMVSDGEQRRVYLETLKEQSGRLATLVENVLAYARLEEGHGSRRQKTGVAELLGRHRPALERRAKDAGMELVTRVDERVAASTLTTDGDAVGQVLFNLVDNACKYAHAAADRRVECAARVDG